MERLGFMINETGRRFRDLTGKIANDKGVGMTEFFICNYLSKSTKNEVTQKDICTITRMKPSTISITLTNLEEKGYIKRTKSDTDNRKTILNLTEKGIDTANKCKEFFDEAESLLSTCLTSEELNIFIDCLNKMNAAMENYHA